MAGSPERRAGVAFGTFRAQLRRAGTPCRRRTFHFPPAGGRVGPDPAIVQLDSKGRGGRNIASLPASLVLVKLEMRFGFLPLRAASFGIEDAEFQVLDRSIGVVAFDGNFGEAVVELIGAFRIIG